MSDEINLGIRLRRIRDMKGRTIRGLAAKTGISSSLISKIELGKANPSLATLKRITEELEVPMFYLFIENETDGSVVRKEERVKLVVTGGIEETMVSPDLNHQMEMVWTEAEPDALTGESPMQHKSEECTLIIKGEIHFYIGEELYILKEGDAVYLNANTPHHWENPGAEPAQLVSVYSLRNPSDTTNDSNNK